MAAKKNAAHSGTAKEEAEIAAETAEKNARTTGIAGTANPASKLCSKTAKSANFDARRVKCASNSSKHLSDAFDWIELCNAVEAPEAHGSISGIGDIKEYKKNNLPGLCRPCHGNRRKAQSVKAAGYLVLDFDGDADFDDVAARLRQKRLSFAAHTTSSHRLGTNTVDRFRVYVPIDDPKAAPELVPWATSWLVCGVLKLKLGAVDDASFDIEQLMFLPGVFEENKAHYRHEIFDGTPAPIADWADCAQTIGYVPPSGSSRPASPTDYADVDAAVVRATMASDLFARWVQEHLAYAPATVEMRGNFVRIRCPWADEHTDPTDDEAGFLPRIAGRRAAVFHCFHAHCQERGIGDLQQWAREEGCPHTTTRLESLYFIVDTGRFVVDIDTMHQYPLAGVDALVPKPQWPTVTHDGTGARMPPSRALRDNEYGQWFDTVTYDPDEPQVIENRMLVANADGYVEQSGARMLNTYERPAVFADGNARKARKWWWWLLRELYGSDESELKHALQWMAFAVRHPGKKINHALVLCGAQGIGKDSLLHPIERLIGYANVRSIDADAVFSEFNAYRARVLLKVNEVRPSADHTLTALYEKLKTTIAAPPTLLDVNEKYQPRRWVRNFVKVVLTTNHPDALHVPEDDRRLFVLDTDRTQGWCDEAWFRDYYNWCDEGGVAHVGAYLETIDLTDFDPGAPPPRTRAWKTCVANRRTVGGDDACAVALDVLATGGVFPDVVFAADLSRAVRAAADPNDDTATDSRLKTLQHKPSAVRKAMGAHGYSPLENPGSEGRWIYKRRSDGRKVKLGLAWVQSGVTAARVEEVRKQRMRSDSE